MKKWFSMFYIRNAIVILIIFVPLLNWTYDTLYFNDYIARAINKTVQIVDTATASYRITKLSALSRDKKLSMPVAGVLMSQVNDSWGDPRDGGTRTHKGIDIFAKRGTPIYPAVPGIVQRTGSNGIGGNHVYIVGAGGVRYYYAHLQRIADGIKFGAEVTSDTVIGYVGNTGNAANTPSHLHFGMYLPNQGAKNPFSLLVDRSQGQLAQQSSE